MRSELIALDIEQLPSGRLFGQSKDLPGINATGDTLDAISQKASEIIAQLYDCREQAVTAYEIPHLRSEKQIWFAAIPTAELEKRLAA